MKFLTSETFEKNFSSCSFFKKNWKYLLIQNIYCSSDDYVVLLLQMCRTKPKHYYTYVYTCKSVLNKLLCFTFHLFTRTPFVSRIVSNSSLLSAFLPIARYIHTKCSALILFASFEAFFSNQPTQARI